MTKITERWPLLYSRQRHINVRAITYTGKLASYIPTYFTEGFSVLQLNTKFSTMTWGEETPQHRIFRGPLTLILYISKYRYNSVSL